MSVETRREAQAKYRQSVKGTTPTLRLRHFTCPRCDKSQTTRVAYLTDKFVKCKGCGKYLVVMYDADGLGVEPVDTVLRSAGALALRSKEHDEPGYGWALEPPLTGKEKVADYRQRTAVA